MKRVRESGKREKIEGENVGKRQGQACEASCVRYPYFQAKKNRGGEQKTKALWVKCVINERDSEVKLKYRQIKLVKVLKVGNN